MVIYILGVLFIREESHEGDPAADHIYLYTHSLSSWDYAYLIKKRRFFAPLSPPLDDPLLACSLVRTTSRTEITQRSRSTSVTTRADDLPTINDNKCRTKGGWHTSHQFVVGERQKIELGHKTKLGWKGPCELIVLEWQKIQLGQETKLRWKGTCQLVAVEN